MNYHSNNSTRKNSVNSSLATIKLPSNINQMNQTLNKQKQKVKIRFSHQETLQARKVLQKNSSFKQNINSYNNMNTSLAYWCMNHQAKQATHVTLQNTQQPMYYCQRCAILIASKGFNITSLQYQYEKQNTLQKINRSFTSKNSINDNAWISCNNNNNKIIKNKNHEKFQKVKMDKKGKKYNENIVYLNQSIASEMEQFWSKLKSKRQQCLSQVDVCVNALNQNIDKLEDYFYTLHQYIQKQKNIQIKVMLTKKQSLQNLRSQVSKFFINQFINVKNIKQQLVKFKQCDLQKYKLCLNQFKFHNLQINSHSILRQFTVFNKFQLDNAHYLGQQILTFLQNFNYQMVPTQNLEKQTINYLQNMDKDHRQYQSQYKNKAYNPNSYAKNNEQKQRFSFKNISLPNNHISKQIAPRNQFFVKHQKRQQNKCRKNQQFFRQLRPSIQKRENKNQTYNQQKNIVKNIQSSIRSLQLSFASSQNDNQRGDNTKNRQQQSNNFTLNQYINRNEQNSSYATNLLLTSTQI